MSVDTYIGQSDQIARDSHQYISVEVRILDPGVILYPDAEILGNGCDPVSGSSECHSYFISALVGLLRVKSLVIIPHISLPCYMSSG